MKDLEENIYKEKYLKESPWLKKEYYKAFNQCELLIFLKKENYFFSAIKMWVVYIVTKWTPQLNICYSKGFCLQIEKYVRSSNFKTLSVPCYVLYEYITLNRVKFE